MPSLMLFKPFVVKFHSVISNQRLLGTLSVTDAWSALPPGLCPVSTAPAACARSSTRQSKARLLGGGGACHQR